MEQIIVLDIRPADFWKRMQWRLGGFPVVFEEIPLPFCRLRKLYVPYYKGWKPETYERILQKVREKFAGWTFMTAESDEIRSLAPFDRYRQDASPLLRRICFPIVSRLFRVCGFSAEQTPLYIRAEELSDELEQLLVNLCDLSKYIYVDIQKQDGLDERMQRIYESTGACLLPGESFEGWPGYCVGILWSGNMTEHAAFAKAEKTVLLNLSTNPAEGFTHMIDGVILDAQAYSVLQPKAVCELKLASLLGFKPDDVQISGFAYRGQPLFLRGLQNS